VCRLLQTRPLGRHGHPLTKGSNVTNATRPAHAGGVEEFEALCAELREMHATVGHYRETIAGAARYIACGLADRPILPVSDPQWA
jgi:hypothetical protein